LGEVVATVLVFADDFGRAAEFGAEDDERVVEHPAAVEVLEEGGEPVVEVFGASWDGGEVIVVSVPAAEGDLDEADPVFDETAGEETALAEAGFAVEFLHFGWFLGDVEAFEVFAAHEAEGVGVEIVVLADGGIIDERVELLVHGVGEFEPFFEIGFADGVGAHAVLETLTGFADGDAGVFGSHEAAGGLVGVGTDGDVAGEVGIAFPGETDDP